MSTDLLYMQAFDVEDCNAKIIKVSEIEDGRVDIILDQTCFYARGGGQDWDQGFIRKADAKFKVEEVRLDETGVVHHIGTVIDNDLREDDAVECEVDHVRRGINMRLHSAAHVIDMAVAELGLDWVGTKGQHYPHLSAIEYSGTWEPSEAENLREALERQANAFIEKGSENSIRFMPVTEMHTVCRNVPDNIPTNKPGRVVMYGDFGVPCGGTHLKNIHEVGRITIPKLKAKKGVIRLNYVVEGISAD